MRLVLGGVSERRRPGAAAAAAGGRSGGEHLGECPPEVGVAERIENGIEGGVDVAEPEGDPEEGVVHALLAARHHEEDDEVREPANDEGAHDDAQLPRGFPLLEGDEDGGPLMMVPTPGARGLEEPAARCRTVPLTLVACSTPLRPVHVFHVHSDVVVVARHPTTPSIGRLVAAHLVELEES